MPRVSSRARRTPVAAALVAVVTAMLVASTGGTSTAADRGLDGRVPMTAQQGDASADPSQAAAIARTIRTSMRDNHLRAVIVKVSVDGRNVMTRAFGESMTGVPATTDMHFRNGSVSISYMANVLLQLVDDGTVSLDDKVSRWLPTIPHANEVTLGQLARMTSGYQDYVRDQTFIEGFLANPFRHWTTLDQLEAGAVKPLWFAPGTGWSYAHTNYVILGLALEKITGMPLRELVRTRVLEPMGLDQTRASVNAPIPEPVLHAFSAERRDFLGIPDGTPFYEESSIWNPSWTLAQGAIQTTDITDLHATAIAFGTGALLSRESYRASISTDLRGFGGPVPGCDTCATQTVRYSYGIGLVTTGDWIMQNPLFGGYSAVTAYLPSERIAIAIAVTYKAEAFENNGPVNQAQMLVRQVGALLAPDNAPPT